MLGADSSFHPSTALLKTSIEWHARARLTASSAALASSNSLLLLRFTASIDTSTSRQT